MRPVGAVLLALSAGAAVAACGVEYPDEPAVPAGEQAEAAEASEEERGDDHGWRAKSPRPVAPPDGHGGDAPAEVVSAYARAFSNWTWRDVADQNGTVLARLTTGELRAVVRANAHDLRGDPTLERDRQANRGELLALDVQGSGPRRRVWVVLRETASARGVTTLSDTRTTVYLATAELLDDGRWYVTGFAPQG